MKIYDIDINQLIIDSRLNEKTYTEIGAVLGINPAMVQHIETHPHYRPGKRIRKILQAHIPGKPKRWKRIQDLSVADLTHAIVNREVF